MSSVCIHYEPDRPISPRQFADLAEKLTAVIEDCLGADREKIQIMPVQLACPPLGRPVYIEIKARDNKTRGDEVLGRFIEQVDEITFRALGGVDVGFATSATRTDSWWRRTEGPVMGSWSGSSSVGAELSVVMYPGCRC